MPRLCRLSGAEVIAIPDHAELDAGTCRAILRQASRFIPESNLRPHFYTD